MAKLLSDRTAQRLHNALDIVENLPEAQAQPRRRVRTKSKGGGGAERPYVIITSVISPSEYIGNVLTSPDDATVKESTVDIRVPGALGNPFEVGYTAFSDKVEDVYYLDGFLLG